MPIIGVPRNKTEDELRATPTWVICEHNRSQRSCPHCDVNAQADEIAALKERVSVLESTLAHAITEVLANEEAAIAELFFEIAAELGQPEAAAEAILPVLRSALKAGRLDRALAY